MSRKVYPLWPLDDLSVCFRADEAEPPAGHDQRVQEQSRAEGGERGQPPRAHDSWRSRLRRGLQPAVISGQQRSVGLGALGRKEDAAQKMQLGRRVGGVGGGAS